MSRRKVIICAHKKSLITPCVVTDGDVAFDEHGKCIGCGRTKEEIVSSKPKTEKNDKVVIPKEMLPEMSKIHKTNFAFHKAMDMAMAQGLLKGKKGWDTDPPWSFINKIEESVSNIKNGQNIEKECVDVANFCMMIWRKTR